MRDDYYQFPCRTDKSVMKPSEIIQQIHDLLSDPKRWIKNAQARMENGRPVMPRDTRATCWCLSGARDKFIYPEEGSDLFRKVHEYLTGACSTLYSTFNMVAFNDDRKTTHDNVRHIVQYAHQKAIEDEAGSH